MSSLRQRILAPALAALFVSPAFGQQALPPPPAPAVPQPPAPAQPAQPPAPAQPAAPAQPPAPAQPATPLRPPGQAVPATTTQDIRATPSPTSTGRHQPQSMNFGPPLYQNPNVSRSLNLSNDQLSRLRDTTTQLQAQYRNQALQLVNLPPAERTARMQELERNYTNDLTKHVDRVLTPEQRTRYRQLELQSRGPGVFADIAVQRQLNLTRDQRERLRAIDEQTNRALRELARTAQGNRTEANRRYEALLRDTDNQINSVLSPDQRRAWQEMVGERFTFPPDFDRLRR